MQTANVIDRSNVIADKAGSTLSDLYFKPFNIVLTYLDGESLSVFASHFGSADLLLVFAQTWALAVRLNLLILQN